MQDYIPYKADFKLYKDNIIKLNHHDNNFIKVKRLQHIYKEDLDNQVLNFMFELCCNGLYRYGDGFRIPEENINNINWE
jgi:hypothetical protein